MHIQLNRLHSYKAVSSAESKITSNSAFTTLTLHVQSYIEMLLVQSAWQKSHFQQVTLFIDNAGEEFC